MGKESAYRKEYERDKDVSKVNTIFDVFKTKTEKIVDDAAEKITKGRPLTNEQEKVISALKGRVDNAVWRGNIPSESDQRAWIALWDAYDRKDGVYKGGRTNPWHDMKVFYDKNMIIRIYGRGNIDPAKMTEEQKNMELKKIAQDNTVVRRMMELGLGKTTTPFKTPLNALEPGSEETKASMNKIMEQRPWNNNKGYKRYTDEPLNGRITKVKPIQQGDSLNLVMTIDGQQRDIKINNKATIDAFRAGALPLNVLANKALEQWTANESRTMGQFMLAQEQWGQNNDMPKGIGR